MAESAQPSAIDARVHRGQAIDPVMRLGRLDQLRVDPGVLQELISRRCCQSASGRSSQSPTDPYQVEGGSDGALQFRRPDGRPMPGVPAPPSLLPDPVEALRAEHAARGLRLHARAGLTGWMGERLDTGYVPHPLAARASVRRA